LIGGVIVGVARCSPTLFYYRESPVVMINISNNEFGSNWERVLGEGGYLEKTTASMLLRIQIALMLQPLDIAAS